MTQHAEFLAIKKYRDVSYPESKIEKKARFARVKQHIEQYYIQINRTQKIKANVLKTGKVLSIITLIAFIVFFKSFYIKTKLFFNHPIEEFEANIFYGLHKIGITSFIIGFIIYINNPYNSIFTDSFYLAGNVIEAISFNFYIITAFSWLFAIIGLQLAWDKIGDRSSKMKFQWLTFFLYIIFFLLSILFTFNLNLRF